MRVRFKVLISSAAVVVLLMGAVVAYSFFRPASAGVTSTATFDFDASRAPGWFAGNSVDGSDINADAAPTSLKMATTTRIIAQGTAEKPDGNCFVQYSYWADTSKDINQVLDELTTPSADSITLEPINTLSLTMKTPTGDTPFEFHQYNMTGPGTSQMSTGEEFGVLKAGTGYIDIRGYCKTGDELPVTLPVLSAVSFKL